MAAAQRAKASDKQDVCKKLMAILKKRYKPSTRKNDRPVLETILYAICLENATTEQADVVYERLGTHFHDLNEVRVSSISELTEVFRGLDEPELRALRVRKVLHFVFEKHFIFEFETLKRKTLDLANKQLLRIKPLSPFNRLFTLQVALGSHLVPVDDSMCGAAIWLGLAEPGTATEAVSGTLKSAVRKADAALFCELLRSLANDPLVKRSFTARRLEREEDGFDLGSSPTRLNELYVEAVSGKKKKPAKKKAAKGAAAKASTRKKAATQKKTTRKVAKTSKKKAATRKSGSTTAKVVKKTVKKKAAKKKTKKKSK